MALEYKRIKARDLKPGMVMQDPRGHRPWATLVKVKVGKFGVDLSSSHFAYGGHSLFKGLDSDVLVEVRESPSGGD